MEYAPFNPNLWKNRVPKLNTPRVANAFEQLLNECKANLGSYTRSRSNGSELYFKKTAYNWLTFCRKLPPCYIGNEPVPHTKFATVSFVGDHERDLCLLLGNGKLMLIYWFAVSDDFDVTRWNFEEFALDLDHLSQNDRTKLLRWIPILEDAMEKALQFKLNAGRKVGTYNLARCRHVTDQTDLVFARALDIMEAWEDIELYYIQTVKTDFLE